MRRQEGFTLPEVLIALVTCVMLVGGVWLTYLMAMRSWLEGSRNAGLERTAGLIMERIVRGPSGRFGLREADIGEVQISESGNSVTYMVDQNDPPTHWNWDDVTSQFYLSETNVIYDPDISIPGNERVLNRFGQVDQLTFSRNGAVLSAKIVISTEAPRTSARRLVARLKTDIFFRKRR